MEALAALLKAGSEIWWPSLRAAGVKAK